MEAFAENMKSKRNLNRTPDILYELRGSEEYSFREKNVRIDLFALTLSTIVLFY